MNNDTKKNFDIQDIMSMLPHRYPFLLVDKVIDVEPGESAVGIKNVTMNEPHFTGHFPDRPIMPGVLIVEALAQTAAMAVLSNFDKDDATRPKGVYFMTIESARFRKPVIPGDCLELHVQKIQARSKVWKFCGRAVVGDKLCAEANFSAMITSDNI